MKETQMELNSDFSERVAVHSASIPWQASPAKGVNRRMLDRIGGEVARATTIVRFDVGSVFDPHTHGGGEEFVVLSGVFQDEHGDYPAGTYVRNPPSTRHTPRSDDGCIILVKLWQFDPADRDQFSTNMNDLTLSVDPNNPTIHSSILFKDDRETVRIEQWYEGPVILGADGGAEYFVLEGAFEFKGTSFVKGSWLRLPERDLVSINVLSEGAQIWSKTGHLPFAEAPQI
jgi:quercetin dioxygenase-like cupin family protein